MSQFGKELKVYADQGLRTALDWFNRGRDIVAESKPRSEAVSRGSVVALFSRDQTQARIARPREKVSKVLAEVQP